MADTIIRCIEEEYAPFVFYPWRRRDGWRVIAIAFRGPEGMPFFVSSLLTVLGVWRFARRPRRLADADAADFFGAVVSETCSHLGSYGAGGPGFVGLRLKLRDGRHVWAVFTLWAAAGWLTVDDHLVAEGYGPDERRALAGTRRFKPLSDLVGMTVTGVRAERDFAELAFADTEGACTLTLRKDSGSLPVHGGSKQPKALDEGQDVRDAVVLSQRARLWVD